MINTITDTIFNGLLMGSTGYAMFTIYPKEYPFAFTACAVGFCHVCVGICCRLLKKSEKLKRVKILSKTCLEIISVPMINIELYKISQQSNTLALGHGLFIVPLIFELANQLWDLEGNDGGESTSVLKDLTILGNMVSLLFYAVNENNIVAGYMAFAAFFANYGSTIMESYLKGMGKNCSLGGYATFFALLPSALSAGRDGMMVL